MCKKEMDDWRLQGQEQYLKGVELVLIQYSPSSPGNDHDHCEFCSEKFMVNKPNCLTTGYTTKDRYYWVCSSCYEDFRGLFKWQLIT